MAKVLVSGLVWVSVLSGNAVVWFWAAVITSLASNLKKGLVAFSSAMVEGAVGLFSAVNFCAFFRRSAKVFAAILYLAAVAEDCSAARRRKCKTLCND